MRQCNAESVLDAWVSGFTQGEEHGFNVVFARRAKMNETRTQSKNMIDLCQIKKIIAYLSKLLAGGRFEVEQISNPKIPSKMKIFIGFSMKNRNARYTPTFFYSDKPESSIHSRPFRSWKTTFGDLFSPGGLCMALSQILESWNTYWRLSTMVFFVLKLEHFLNILCNGLTNFIS